MIEHIKELMREDPSLEISINFTFEGYKVQVRNEQLREDRHYAYDNLKGVKITFEDIYMLDVLSMVSRIWYPHHRWNSK